MFWHVLECSAFKNILWSLKSCSCIWLKYNAHKPEHEILTTQNSQLTGQNMEYIQLWLPNPVIMLYASPLKQNLNIVLYGAFIITKVRVLPGSY